MINLYGQQITGSISTYVGELLEIERFVIQKNHVTGSIPSEIGLLVQLTELGLAGNRLTGAYKSI
jgi:hypothetical protein